MQGAACFDGPPSEALQFTQQLPVPSADTGQVLVRVHTMALNDMDVKATRGSSTRAGPVFVPGFEFAGTVVEIGGGCRRLAVGDAVWGLLPPETFGACAEYVAVDEGRVALKPLDVDWVYAAALPLGATAALRAVLGHPPVTWPPKKLSFIDKKVLIIGAACADGLYALQLCAQLGAEVTTILLPPAPAYDLHILERFGADWVECREPSPEALRSLAKDTPEGFDLVMDCSQPHEAFPDEQRRLLAKGGRHVMRARDGSLQEVHVRKSKRERMRRLLKRVLLMRRGEQAGQPDFPLYMYLDSVRLLADKKVFVPVLDSMSPFFLQDAASAVSFLHSRIMRLPLPKYKVLSLACEGSVCLLTVKAPRIAFLPKGVLLVTFQGEEGMEEVCLDYEGCAEGLQPGETQLVLPDASPIGNELKPRLKVEGTAGSGKVVVKVWPKSQALTLSQVERAMKLQRGKKATRLEPKTD